LNFQPIQNGEINNINRRQPGGASHGQEFSFGADSSTRARHCKRAADRRHYHARRLDELLVGLLAGHSLEGAHAH